MKINLYLWWIFETLTLACNSSRLGFSSAVILPNSDAASPSTKWIKAWTQQLQEMFCGEIFSFCLFLSSEITCDNKIFKKPFPISWIRQVFEGDKKWQVQVPGSTQFWVLIYPHLKSSISLQTACCWMIFCFRQILYKLPHILSMERKQLELVWFTE